METYADSLMNDTIQDLKTRFELLKKLMPNTSVPKKSKKEDLIQSLVSWVFAKENLKVFYSKLTQVEQAALQETVHNFSGVFDFCRIQAKYGSCPILEVSYWDRDKKTQSPLAILFNKSRNLTKDLLLILEEIIPLPQKTKIKSLEQVPAKFVVPRRYRDGSEELSLISHETEQAALADVVSLLRLCEQNLVKVGQATGNVGSATAIKIRELLYAGDFYTADVEAKNKYDVQMGEVGIRPFAWPHILIGGKLAKIENGKLILTSQGKKALQLPPQEVIRLLWRAWLENKLFHEFSRLDKIAGQKAKRNPLHPASGGRQALAKGLAQMPTGKWIAICDFFKFLIALGQGFDVIKDPWTLYIYDREHGSFGYNHVTWEHLNGRFARAFLLEYAATLGLIDVCLTVPWESVTDHYDLWGADDFGALSRYDGLKYFRLTALGEWILGIKNSYEIKNYKSKTQFKLLPNLELALTTQAIAPSDKLIIDRFCDQTSDNLWTLSKIKIINLLEQGVLLEYIEKQLVALSVDQNFPPIFRTFFDDLKKKNGQLSKRGSYVLIECQDAHLALLLANDRELKKFTILVPERQLIVLAEREEYFRRHVKKLGYFLPSTTRNGD